MCDLKHSQSALKRSEIPTNKNFNIESKKCKPLNLHQCSQCSMTFQFQIPYLKHMAGHMRNNCQYCSSLFANRKELIAHVASEHKIKIPESDYQCKYCDKTFGKRIILFKHYKEHANEQIVCMNCGKFLKTEDEYKIHLEKHKENKHWNCERCHESFERRQQYVLHIKNHEKYQCQMCGESFASKNKFRDHKQIVHDIRSVELRHQCSECGQRFLRPKLLMLHFRIHTDEKPHECKDCGKRYRTSRGYAKHLLSSSHQNPEVQKTTKTMKCHNCELEFATKYLLDRHVLRTHKQKTSYKCEFCDQQFNSKENMKRHLALHTEERQYVCEHCAAAFHSLNALKDHISYVHSLVREFVCAKCGMSFKRNSGLNRHMASHSDDRRFVCSCGVKYKRSSHLRRHKETAHGEVLRVQKVVRLKQDERGAFVPIEDSQQVKESRRKKKEEQVKVNSDKEQNIKAVIISLPADCASPPPPAPSLITDMVSLSSHIPSPLTTSCLVSPSTVTLSVQQPSSQKLCDPLPCKEKMKSLSTVLPLVDGGLEMDQFSELCKREDIISDISLESDELIAVTKACEISGADKNKTSSLSENVLQTIVSYNMTDFSTSLAPVTSAESQLVFTTSVPISTINLDNSYKVLTLTFDPLMETETGLKHSDSFSSEKASNREVEESLLLDPSISSQLALDRISDTLCVPSVSRDHASTLITSSNDNVLNSNTVVLPSDDTTLGNTLVRSNSSTMGSASTLFSSVDATFGTLQHSEVLLNMQSHIDCQSSVSPYALSGNLNINVSECESLLASENTHIHNSPSIILTHETEESISLDSEPILPDYLNPNFSFLNV